MEKTPEQQPKKEESVFDRPKFLKFLKDKEIDPEGFKIIKKISEFPINLIIIELHNMFNMNRERSARELEFLIKYTKDEQRIELYKLALDFVKKYGWMVSYRLVRFLEGEL